MIPHRRSYIVLNVKTLKLSVQVTYLVTIGNGYSRKVEPER